MNITEFKNPYEDKPLGERFRILGQQLIDYHNSTEYQLDMRMISFGVKKSNESDVCLACLGGHIAHLVNGKDIDKTMKDVHENGHNCLLFQS